MHHRQLSFRRTYPGLDHPPLLHQASLWLTHGRIAGVSGIFASLPTSSGDDFASRSLFLAGLGLGNGLWSVLAADALPVLAGASAVTYATAGLLVGFGTRLGGGCTSGHGICGLARGSRRSLVAVSTFMASGAATVFVRRHIMTSTPFALAPLAARPAGLVLAAAASLCVASLVATARQSKRLLNFFCSGVTFGVGLAVSGMTHPRKVINFLDVAGCWDPSLALVMGGGLAVSSVGFALARRWPRPACSPAFSHPAGGGLTWRLIAGAALFGIGWGIGGVCPGPSIANAVLPLVGAEGSMVIFPAIAMMMLGSRAADLLVP
jgi:uncharacterized membrane protein YedE/YeeE